MYIVKVPDPNGVARYYGPFDSRRDAEAYVEKCGGYVHVLNTPRGLWR